MSCPIILIFFKFESLRYKLIYKGENALSDFSRHVFSQHVGVFTPSEAVSRALC